MDKDSLVIEDGKGAKAIRYVSISATVLVYVFFVLSFIMWQNLTKTTAEMKTDLRGQINKVMLDTKNLSDKMTSMEIRLAVHQTSTDREKKMNGDLEKLQAQVIRIETILELQGITHRKK